MSTSALPADLTELPLWRLLVLLDDLEREQGADAPASRRVARVVADRLGLVSMPGVTIDGKGVANAAH